MISTPLNREITPVILKWVTQLDAFKDRWEALKNLAPDCFYYLCQVATRKTQQILKNKSPNWQPWINFFLQTLIKQKNNLIHKIGQERLLSTALPKLAVEILNLVKARGQITVSEIQMATGAARSTIKNRLKELVQNKQLVRYGKGRAAWYELISKEKTNA